VLRPKLCNAALDRPDQPLYRPVGLRMVPGGGAVDDQQLLTQHVQLIGKLLPILCQQLYTTPTSRTTC
jgi:hypothetical protein